MTRCGYQDSLGRRCLKVSGHSFGHRILRRQRKRAAPVYAPFTSVCAFKPCGKTFTPHKRRGSPKIWTICCSQACAHRYVGRLAVETGQHRRAVLQRVKNSAAGIRILLKNCKTFEEAYRIGFRRGVQSPLHRERLEAIAKMNRD